MTEQEPLCYVAHLPCGCRVGACLDDPKHRKDTAKWVANEIRRGCTVTMTTCEKVRTEPFGYVCAACLAEKAAKKKKKPGPLFDSKAVPACCELRGFHTPTQGAHAHYVRTGR